MRLGSSILGTGFFTDEHAHVVTAKHVIDGGRTSATATGQSAEFSVGLAAPNLDEVTIDSVVSLSMARNFQIIGVDVIDEDAVSDLALLKLRSNPFDGEFPAMLELGEMSIQAPARCRLAQHRETSRRRCGSCFGLPASEPCSCHHCGIDSLGMDRGSRRYGTPEPRCNNRRRERPLSRRSGS